MYVITTSDWLCLKGALLNYSWHYHYTTMASTSLCMSLTQLWLNWSLLNNGSMAHRCLGQPWIAQAWKKYDSQESYSTMDQCLYEPYSTMVWSALPKHFLLEPRSILTCMSITQLWYALALLNNVWQEPYLTTICTILTKTWQMWAL